MELPLWMSIAGYALVALMVAYGVMFLLRMPIGFPLAGHTPEGLPQAFGTRFFLIAGLGLAFLLMGETRAFAVLLAAGAVLSVADLIVELKHGGLVAPHIASAIGAAVLAYFFFSYSNASAGVS